MEMNKENNTPFKAEDVNWDELAAIGMGGLCLNCPVCTFPNCGFGKGY